MQYDKCKSKIFRPHYGLRWIFYPLPGISNDLEVVRLYGEGIRIGVKSFPASTIATSIDLTGVFQ
jgi:hypothetical protein